MNCKYCGHPLDIEKAFCPSCGRENEFSKKYRNNMDNYNQQFQQTKKTVIEKNSKTTGLAVNITFVAVLLTLNIALLFMIKSVFEVDYFIDKIIVEINKSEYQENIDLLLEENDLIAFSEYSQSTGISYSSSFRDYWIIDNIADDYVYIYKSLMGFKINPKYHDQEYEFEFLCDNIESFYQYTNRENINEWDLEKFDKYSQTIDETKEKVKVLLSTYANLSDQTIDALPNMSKTEIMLALKEGLSQNDKN